MLLLGLGILASCGRRSSSSTDNIDSIQAAYKDSLAILRSIQQDLNAHADTMLMVIDSRGNVVGRYVRTNADTYTICVQDNVEVPIVGNKVVVFRAADGKGVLYTQKTHVNIRQEPNTTSIVLTQISRSKNGVSDTYPCLGKTGEWYKIIAKGVVGYVREDLVIWDGMNSF